MKKILFIEDEASLQKTFADVLAPEGFQIISALDGEIGVRLAESEKPDLILLDLTLPRLPGLEALSQLKAGRSTSQIPVVILTNREEVQNIERALQLGATTYLVKANYTLNEVVEKIKKACASNPSN